MSRPTRIQPLQPNPRELDAETLGKMKTFSRPFEELMMRYRCAMLEIKTKLDVLDNEFSLENDRNPFESIHCRLKSPQSIAAKLRRQGREITVENIEEGLNDVAGVRVICSFIGDIYSLSEKLCAQDDITVVAVKDYIRSPKENGYRSLHLILEVPIFLSNEKRPMRVEVQFRTIAMDFWASLDHKLQYKKNLPDPERISAELKDCADEIHRLDLRMQTIHRSLESGRTTAE